MQQIKAGMSEKEIEEAVEHCRILHERQAAPDSRRLFQAYHCLKEVIYAAKRKNLTANLQQRAAMNFCMYLPLQTK